MKTLAQIGKNVHKLMTSYSENLAEKTVKRAYFKTPAASSFFIQSYWNVTEIIVFPLFWWRNQHNAIFYDK